MCTSDLTANPVRATIYQYNDDGSGGQLFAKGIRNAEGLAMLPGTNTLWVAVNMRDSILYPSHDGQYPYQAATFAYIDNHPPDEVFPVVQNANYGWPYCNPTPDSAQGYDTCHLIPRWTRGSMMPDRSIVAVTGP